jgi:hypothetical protein
MPEPSLESREELRQWLDAETGDRAERGEALLSRLFPRLGGEEAMSKYDFAEARRERRISAPDAFDTYFGLKLAPDAVGSAEMEHYLTLLTSESALHQELLSLAERKRSDGSTRAEAVLDRFLDHQEDPRLGPGKVPLLRTVLRAGNVLTMADAERSRRGFGIEVTISRLLFQLLPLIQSSERTQLFLDVLANGASLGSTVLQLYRIGEHDNSVRGTGKEIFSEDEFENLKMWAIRMIAAAAEESSLPDDPSFPFLLFRWRDWSDPSDVQKWIDAIAEVDVTRFLRRWHESIGHVDPAELGKLTSVGFLSELALEERWRDPTSLDQRDLELLQSFLDAT